MLITDRKRLREQSSTHAEFAAEKIDEMTCKKEIQKKIKPY